MSALGKFYQKCLVPEFRLKSLNQLPCVVAAGSKTEIVIIPTNKRAAMFFILILFLHFFTLCLNFSNFFRLDWLQICYWFTEEMCRGIYTVFFSEAHALHECYSLLINYYDYSVVLSYGVCWRYCCVFCLHKPTDCDNIMIDLSWKDSQSAQGSTKIKKNFGAVKEHIQMFASILFQLNYRGFIWQLDRAKTIGSLSRRLLFFFGQSPRCYQRLFRNGVL